MSVRNILSLTEVQDSPPSHHRLPSPMPLAGPSLRLPAATHQADHPLHELSPSPDSPALLLPPPALGRAQDPYTTGAAPVSLVPSTCKLAPLKKMLRACHIW
ncbi:hypothetical protein B0H13DRAFT_2359904 [Mycena leptocephala]|nr:hypothetical protein B0H13DRAFT_2359904 [Mycena leptocephala]